MDKKNIFKEKFKRILIKNDKEYTKDRRNLFNLFLNSRLLAKNEIFDKLIKAGKSDRASIYRNLELFIELHILNKFSLLGVDCYELGIEFKNKVIYLACPICKKVDIVKDNNIEGSITDMLEDYNRKALCRTVVVETLCSNCR